ncbi:MAG: serine hydrolase [Propionibacteriaceae bacterium]|nr:serine hydrolase [Propionibacteriaceae bacterium]
MRLLAASLIGSIGVATATLGGMSASAAPPEEPLKTRMAGLQELGFPAVLATVTDAQGQATGVAVGVGDTSTGAAAPVNGQVRIGSNTKTFVAVVIRQLVEEGKVQLDEPVRG